MINETEVWTMKISRRSVLKTGALAAGLGLVGGAGWQLRPTLAADGPVNIALPPGTGATMLIVYGTMMGSTGGQAQWMADAARAAGYRVALYDAENAPAPDEFDRVLVGSAIRASAWLDPVVKWASDHAVSIASRPFGLFQCSMTCAGMLLGNDGAALTDGQKAKLRTDCDSLFAQAPALASSTVAFLPGRLEFSRLTPLLRVGYPFVSGSFMQGDYRAPGAVDDWMAQQL